MNAFLVPHSISHARQAVPVVILLAYLKEISFRCFSFLQEKDIMGKKNTKREVYLAMRRGEYSNCLSFSCMFEIYFYKIKILN